jgi:hypothetical protein
MILRPYLCSTTLGLHSTTQKTRMFKVVNDNHGITLDHLRTLFYSARSERSSGSRSNCLARVTRYDAPPKGTPEPQTHQSGQVGERCANDCFRLLASRKETECRSRIRPPMRGANLQGMDIERQIVLLRRGTRLAVFG